MTIDLTPLYRNTVGFDRFANLLDAARQSSQASTGYPPYDIELKDENQYAITLAVAGFTEDELDIHVNEGVLTISGKKTPSGNERNFLHQGIANRAFERKFNLAEYVEVKGADLNNGLLVVSLVKEVPEAMKPRTITINGGTQRISSATNDENVA